MAMITGRDAALKLDGSVAKVKGWTMDRSNAVKASANSTSLGYEETAKGITKWKATFNLVVDDGIMKLITAFANLEVGEKVFLQGYTTTNQYFSGTVRIESIGTPVEVEGGEIVAAISGVGHGAYTLV
jgi:hypothetical protein